MYKAKWDDGHWIDDAIAIHGRIFNWRFNWKTGKFEFLPWYSHCEIWVPQFNEARPGIQYEEQWFTGSDVYSGPNNYLGTCYTSTMRGDHNGTVSRPASEVLTHPGR